MEKVTRKFIMVPSARKLAVAAAGSFAALGASVSFAADDMASGAVAAITSAQGSGESVGAAVVACVAALCVVGVIIALIRKV